MAKKIRKKHVAIYCPYCQCNHNSDELDVEIEGKDIKVYCFQSGLEIWANKEDKQKLIEIYNN